MIRSFYLLVLYLYLIQLLTPTGFLIYDLIEFDELHLLNILNRIEVDREQAVDSSVNVNLAFPGDILRIL